MIQKVVESETVSFKPANSGVKSLKIDKSTKPETLARKKKNLPWVTSQDYQDFVDYMESDDPVDFASIDHEKQ